MSSSDTFVEFDEKGDYGLWGKMVNAEAAVKAVEDMETWWNTLKQAQREDVVQKINEDDANDSAKVKHNCKTFGLTERNYTWVIDNLKEFEEKGPYGIWGKMMNAEAAVKAVEEMEAWWIKLQQEQRIDVLQTINDAAVNDSAKARHICMCDFGLTQRQYAWVNNNLKVMPALVAWDTPKFRSSRLATFIPPEAGMGAGVHALCSEVRKWIAAAYDKAGENENIKLVLDRSLKELRDIPPPRTSSLDVAFVGGTGGGKSSFINSLIGHTILATSGSPTSCTNCNISITNIPDMEETIKVIVQYRTRQEWNDQLAYLLDYENHKNVEGHQGWKKMKENKVLRAVYKEEDLLDLIKKLKAEKKAKKDETINSIMIQQPFERPELTEVLGIPDARVVHEMTTFAELKDFLRAETIRPENAREYQTEFQVWPLVKAVHVYSKFEKLPAYVTLHDTPGDNDTDQKRIIGNEFHSFIAGMDAVWFLSPEKIASSKAVAKSLKELQTEGIMKNVRVIQTKLDANPHFNGTQIPMWENEIHEFLVDLLSEQLYKNKNNGDGHDYVSEDDDSDSDDSKNGIEKEARALAGDIKIHFVSSIKNIGIKELRSALFSDAASRSWIMDCETARINQIWDECKKILRFDYDAQQLKSLPAEFQNKLKACREMLFASLETITDELQNFNSPRVIRTIMKYIEAAFGNLHYKTLQSIMWRKGAWNPSLAKELTECLLSMSTLEDDWTTLFDQKLRKYAVGCCTKQDEVLTNMLGELHRDMQTDFDDRMQTDFNNLKGINDMQKEFDNRIREDFRKHNSDSRITFEQRMATSCQTARQDLQRTVGNIVRNVLRSSRVFDGYEFGTGCKSYMADHLITHVQQLLPLLLNRIWSHLKYKLKSSLYTSIKKNICSRESAFLRAFRVFNMDLYEHQVALMKEREKQLLPALDSLTNRLQNFGLQDNKATAEGNGKTGSTDGPGDPQAKGKRRSRKKKGKGGKR